MFILQPVSMTALILTLLFACFDWKYREVPLWFAAAVIAVGLAFSIAGRRAPVSVMYAMIPGIIMILVSAVTGGVLGMGDGVYVSCMSLFFEWQQVCVLLAAAFMTAGLAALAIIVRAMIKGTSARGKNLPLLCFMPVGVILVLLTGEG